MAQLHQFSHGWMCPPLPKNLALQCEWPSCVEEWPWLKWRKWRIIFWQSLTKWLTSILILSELSLVVLIVWMNKPAGHGQMLSVMLALVFDLIFCSLLIEIVSVICGSRRCYQKWVVVFTVCRPSRKTKRGYRNCSITRWKLFCLMKMALDRRSIFVEGRWWGALGNMTATSGGRTIHVLRSKYGSLLTNLDKIRSRIACHPTKNRFVEVHQMSVKL